ncbi:MAG: DMT family transporter [Actinobacteria bacterium]|nr:DMT family transporter [Actinomycetota bacterium]
MRIDLLAALAGVFIAIQSRANGELSSRIGNSLEAALISFGSGLVIILLIALFHPGIKRGVAKVATAVREGAIPKWRLMGGALGGIVIAVQTQVVPLMGVAIYSVAVISGQTATSLIVDRIGLTGGGKKMISRHRIVAASLTVLAVLVSVWDRIDAKHLSFLAIALGILSGGVVGIQRALNGQVNEFSGQSFSTSLFNFITGTMLLLILFAGSVVTRQSHLSALPPGPWWMYLGGVTGLIYIAFSATVVQHVGVLTFTLFSIGGQLVGSLLIDLFLPSEGVHVGVYLVTGILMTYLGVLANNDRALGGSRSRRVAND